jgi:hypothetical protein
MKYCSLGSNCHSAQILRRNNLRDKANPFDWLSSDINLIKNCIEDDFKLFLDKSQYYSIPPDEKFEHIRTGHRVYDKPDNYPVFNHHDLLGNDEHYNRFVRSVNRFTNTLKSDEKKVFVYINRPADTRNFEEGLIEVLNFTNFLDKHTTNYTLITIHASVGELNHSIIKGHNLVFIQLSCSENIGMHFEKSSDDAYLDNILKKVIDDIR